MSLCSSCQSQDSTSYELSPDFGSYWYQGKAELASYELEQVRYGEVRKGHTVLIFVTEDFSREKQVKLDNSSNKSDILKVMKLNATRKFNTGIYPYSTMTSVFTPIYLNDDPKTVKLTTASQEWCGHTFLQANLKGNSYSIQGNSYFQSEGDQNYSVDNVLMEDELWTRIRLNPDNLPTGRFEMLPGSLYCRFKHIPFKPELAGAEKIQINDSTSTFSVTFPDLKRSLKINFENRFPYKILEWEEEYPEGGELMTTKATLKKSIQLDYWNKNKNSDESFRLEMEIAK